MVDISDYVAGPGDDDDGEAGEAADLAALKASLQALADAIASTNLAVINNAQGDTQGAVQRVQASVAALKRFHDAFAVLKTEEDEDGAEAPDAEEGY